MNLQDAIQKARKSRYTIDGDLTLLEGGTVVGEILRHRATKCSDEYCVLTGLDKPGPEGELARKVRDISDEFNALVREAPHLPQDYPDLNECQERLRKTEWQRWTPGLGLYRIFKDKGKNSDILDGMHSLTYTITNIYYNALTSSALLGGVVVSLAMLLK